MRKPPFPANEAQRLQALRGTGLLDTPAEERFDRLTRLARQMFDVQTALVSLVDAERQWFKSRQGLTACETGRDISFCGHAILGADIFEVADATLDPRFADNPLVSGAPHIRFYAGAPLSTTKGFRVGTLCLIDSQPRRLTAEQRRALRDLADCVEDEINALHARRLQELLTASRARSETILRTMPDIVLVVDRQGRFLDSNEHPDLVVPRAELLGRSVGEILPSALAARCMEAVARALDGGETVSFEYSLAVPQGPAEFEARLQKINGDEVLIVIRNISRERAAQAELARLSRVASETTNGVVITDAAGRVEWINDGFTRITGYTLAEMRGRDPGTLLQGTDTDPASVAIMHDALAHQESFEVDVINYTKSGQPYWIRISCNPLRGANGELQGFMAIESDITREKHDAERIRVSERRLAAVIDGTRIGTWEWNVQTGETVFNELWAEIAGYTLAELAPISIQTWIALAHPEDLASSNALLQKHFSRELDFYDCQCRMRHKQGYWIWVHDRGRVVSWTEEGKPLLMSGTHADITEQKQAEMALHQFKATLDRTLDCVFMFDAETFRFTYCNEGAMRQVGYSREELLDMHPYDIKPQYTVQQFKLMIAPLLMGERDALTFETVHRHKSGRDIPVEVFLQYVRQVGETPRFVAIVRDISERKRIDRMKNEFVSTVSHELRTPLTSITGSLGLVAGGALGEMPAQARDMIAIAYRNSQRLACLINDLLDMEKLVAGKMRFDMQPQALLPLIEQALEANRSYGADRQVLLRLTSVVPQARVNVDSQRLLQVMANLLSNAIKYSNSGDTVEVAMSEQGAMARITVIDHGPGVPAAFRPRIFQKFSQADASDSRQRGGTGLGLAITRELVERMGGTIGFHSEEGKGAAFFFDFPLLPTAGA